MDYDLFKDYFDSVVPSALAKNYMKQKINKINDLIEEIKNRWSNLKDEIEKISEDEKEIEQPDNIFKIV